jgi:menaquinone-specific isochorismate synthase
MWEEQGADYPVAELEHGAGSRPRTVSAPSLPAALDKRLNAACTPDVIDRLAALAPGRLVSLSLRLPATLAWPEGTLSGDTHWRAPGGERVLDALGNVAEYADAAAYRAERAGWLSLGPAELSPLAFFTLPPATELAPPSLRVPLAVLSRSPAGACLTVSARRGSEPPQAIVANWRRAAAALAAQRAPARLPGRILAIEASPAAEDWQDRVRATRAAIGAGRFAKAVIARRLRVALAQAPDAAVLAQRLMAKHADCHVIVMPHGAGRVVAATPELLALKRGAVCVSHAVAGTARRYGDAASDARSAAALQASPKERREHALVVGEIAARMAALCDAVAPAPEPALLRLRHVQHLWTKVSGHLRNGADLLDVATRLHPTPAVLGLPAAAAGAWLAELGERRDGLYTGVAGWIDGNGDGDAVVLLRSAWLAGNAAVLWAGAGIMAESDPAAELAETELKLATMLEVLGTAI